MSGYLNLFRSWLKPDLSMLVSGTRWNRTRFSRAKPTRAELEFLAHHDTLTSLPNRLRLFFRLEHGIDEARRANKQLALLMLDLDRFKEVNDSFGHSAGDQLLQMVAKRLSENVRHIDTVARLGGDEFTIVLEDIAHAEDAARIAMTIIASLGGPWSIPGAGEVQIGASVGISLYPQHGRNAELLLQQADTALYKAKEDGRNRFAFYSNELTVVARERIDLETRLRRALTNNELRVFFQPQIDMVSGEIVGAEALVNWLDPAEGLIAPEHFVPVAEQTGLIQAIGSWALKETCRQGKQWLRAGFKPLPLAVNISQNQLRQTDINALVMAALQETGFPGEFLELELAENTLMGCRSEAMEKLRHLREQGIRLAIDDFGTGYSSLAHLKHLPLMTLKIDKSIVESIPDKQDDREIATVIIAMAHIMGYKVMAEGVENQRQWAFLKEKGCDFYQGYLYSKPLPAEAFTQLLQKVYSHAEL